MHDLLVFIKNTLGFALLGCVLAGSLFGFFVPLAWLDTIRALGGILSVLLVSVFAPDLLKVSNR